DAQVEEGRDAVDGGDRCRAAERGPARIGAERDADLTPERGGDVPERIERPDLYRGTELMAGDRRAGLGPEHERGGGRGCDVERAAGGGAQARRGRREPIAVAHLVERE